MIEAAADQPIDLSMDSQTFRLFYIGMESLESGFARGDMTGNATKARAIVTFFDWPRQAGSQPASGSRESV